MKSTKLKKKNILIYANCQGIPIYTLLNKHFPEYKVDHIETYKHIRGKKKLPTKLFKNCDIFIYQPIGAKHKEYSTDFIIKKLLNKKAKLISFPYIYFLGYFPSHIKNPPEEDFPEYPKYPMCGVCCKKILEMCQKGKTAKETYNALSNKNLFTKEEVNQTLKYTLGLLREKEKITDIQVADFIEENFRDKDLFHTPNHPARYLMTHFLEQLFKKLGIDLKKIINSQDSALDCLPGYGTMPIYPSVKKILRLKFDHEPAYLGGKIKLIDYIHLYRISLNKSTLLETLMTKTKFKSRILISEAEKCLDKSAGRIGVFLRKISLNHS